MPDEDLLDDESVETVAITTPGQLRWLAEVENL